MLRPLVAISRTRKLSTAASSASFSPLTGNQSRPTKPSDSSTMMSGAVDTMSRMSHAIVPSTDVLPSAPLATKK